MKVLVLVQSIDAGPYKEIMQTQKDTWDSIDNPNIRTLFYIPSMEIPAGIIGKNLYVNYPPQMAFMYIHLMKACVHALKFEWDYLFKTDNSTYVNKQELLNILATKPKVKYCGGHPFWKQHPNRKDETADPGEVGEFPWGDGYALSRDIVQKLVDMYTINRELLNVIDDYALAFALKGRCEIDYTLRISLYHEEGFSPNKHVYRCVSCTSNASLDIEYFTKTIKSIHEQLTK